MESEPHGLGFQLPTFFFPFLPPLYFAFFHDISFSLQFASNIGTMYMSSLWGPQVSISLQVRPQGQHSEPPVSAGALSP